MKLSRRNRFIVGANLAMVVGEVVVMMILPELKIENKILEALLDAAVLVAIATPLMHFMLHDSELELETANRRLSARMAEMDARAADGRLLREMGELMLASRCPRETYEIVARYIGRLFPATRGCLYVLRHSRNSLEVAGAWGEAHQSEPWFAPEECWAFRRGKRHLVLDADESLICGHVTLKGLSRYCCVPLTANGEALGMLHIESDGASGDTASEAPVEFKMDILASLAEHVALALANNRLQERLESQSIRDPLTGLYNRRFLEESFAKDLHRAQRKSEPVGVLMMDLDHFKSVNDEYGHDAGDAVLRAVTEQLFLNIRAEDVACRFGGEEFLLILPGIDVETLRQRAELILRELSGLRLTHGGRLLRPVTASIGLACFPVHGADQNTLLHAADTALYASKNGGRNRATVFEASCEPADSRIEAA